MEIFDGVIPLEILEILEISDGLVTTGKRSKNFNQFLTLKFSNQIELTVKSAGNRFQTDLTFEMTSFLVVVVSWFCVFTALLVLVEFVGSILFMFFRWSCDLRVSVLLFVCLASTLLLSLVLVWKRLVAGVYGLSLDWFKSVLSPILIKVLCFFC